ncbi:MAG: serine O-acetyltransferase [Coriobacteriales bacterium]|jgi:serine O-acetyltransferase|nr:serine O-acetyltransferase [Coriobacteriales bacterium]
MFNRLREDIAAVKERDPAATSSAGVLINYPGVQALAAHRFQHFLWKHNRRGIARFLSQCTRFFTGVEIHPGAEFGRRVFIDHGMGVIVGETAVVGNDVTIFQGVTLGGTGKEHGKRHPNVEDGAVIGVGAAVLGNVTIGARTKVGGGAVVVDNVPPDCTVVGIPGHVVTQNGIRICPADPFRRELLPDPVEEQMAALAARIAELESQSLGSLEGVTTHELLKMNKRLDELEAELDTLMQAFNELRDGNANI